MTVTTRRAEIKYGNKHYTYIFASSHKYNCTVCHCECSHTRVQCLRDLTGIIIDIVAVWKKDV